MATTLNEGMLLCRKLGWNPVRMIVGKNEWKQMICWTYSGQSENDKLEVTGKIFGFKVGVSSRRSELIFLCRPWKDKLAPKH